MGGEESKKKRRKAKPSKKGGLLGRKIPPSQRWEGGKMAALASSLIRQKRAVKDDQANRPVANKRKPCPKSNKSLCQKQILVLISKVRLCGGRKGRNEKRPGEWQLSGSIFLRWHLFFSLRCWNESWTNVCFYLFYENGVFTFSQGIKHKKKTHLLLEKQLSLLTRYSIESPRL